MLPFEYNLEQTLSYTHTGTNRMHANHQKVPEKNQINWPGNPFWDFSLQYYNKDGIPELLLYLQDSHDLDVNLILLGIWAGIEFGYLLCEEDFSKLDFVAGNWRKSIIEPLRKMRIELKVYSTLNDKLLKGVRENIKKLELDAEHVAQIKLSDQLATFTAIPTSDDFIKAAGLNLGVYFDYTNNEVNSALEEKKDFLVWHLRK